MTAQQPASATIPLVELDIESVRMAREYALYRGDVTLANVYALLEQALRERGHAVASALNARAELDKILYEGGSCHWCGAPAEWCPDVARWACERCRKRYDLEALSPR